MKRPSDTIVLMILAVFIFAATTAILFYFKFQEDKLLFTSKLVDFKPPTFGCPAYLVFENGRIIQWQDFGLDVTSLRIGTTYQLWQSHIGNYLLVVDY